MEGDQSWVMLSKACPCHALRLLQHVICLRSGAQLSRSSPSCPKSNREGAHKQSLSPIQPYIYANSVTIMTTTEHRTGSNCMAYHSMPQLGIAYPASVRHPITITKLGAIVYQVSTKDKRMHQPLAAELPWRQCHFSLAFVTAWLAGTEVRN